MAILNSNGEIEVGDELKEEIEYLKESGCLKPVSYTHLDVYKRQT